MANKIGSTPKEIHDYERGYTDIPIEILYEIAKTLSVNIKALGLTEYENEPVLRFVGKCEKIEDQELLDTVARCMVPECDGMIECEKKYHQRRSYGYTGAPEHQRQYVRQYKIVKRA